MRCGGPGGIGAGCGDGEGAGADFIGRSADLSGRGIDETQVAILRPCKRWFPLPGRLA